jgi:hypothetical protein
MRADRSPTNIAASVGARLLRLARREGVEFQLVLAEFAIERLLHRLAEGFAFDGPRLARAIRATFDRRGTPMPDVEPLVFAPEFLAAPERRKLWSAFLRLGRLEGPPDTTRLANRLREFLWPVLAAATRGQAFEQHWVAGGPWAPRGGGEEIAR